MRFSILGLIVACSCYYDFQTVMCYKIPPVKLEVLPAGFRVSIPHESGVENVAFNINRNRPFKAFEPGEFSDRIRTPAVDNRWSYDGRRRLQNDDVIYVWTDVQHNKMRFRSMSPPITVREVLNGLPQIDTVTNERNEYSSPLVTTTTSTIGPPEIDKRNDKCEQSLTTISNRNVKCQGQIIFEDNFDGDVLNMSLWRYEVRLPLDNADAEFVLYDTNAELSNGVLKIKPRLWGDDRPDADIRRGQLSLGARCTAYQNPEMECQRQPFGRVVLPPVVTARINTKHAFSFKYGRVEVRAKLPKGDWLFPLLLLEPLVNYYGQHPYASGQMRIAFLRSNVYLETNDGANIGGHILHGGAILRPEARYRETFMLNTSRNAHFGDTFHTYSLTWNERSLSLDVDGQIYGIVNDEHGIESVIYNIEINQQCPEIYDLITERKGNLWISEQATNKLSANDEVLINIVLQHDEGLYARTDKIKITNNYGLTFQAVKESDHTIDACNIKTWDDYAPNMGKRSTSRVYVNNNPSKRLYEPNDLLFEDNFDKLDTKVWSYDMFMYSNAIGDNSEEFTLFTDSKDNLAVKDGKLQITPIISPRLRNGIYSMPGCKAPTCYEDFKDMCSYKKQLERPYSYPAPVDSARIKTINSFSFAYGRVEIGARLPYGDWLIPYVMLEPDKMNCSMRKQLRIAYAKPKDFDKSRIWGGPVVLDATDNPSNQKHIFERTSHMTFSANVQPNQFHNFTLIWTPTQIALYVDKHKYGCFSNHHQYDESYHIVLGVSAGGHLEYKDSPSKPWVNGYNNASHIFHESFQGCCSKGSGDCIDTDARKKERKCSQPWGLQSAMAIDYVRVYAV